MAGWSKAAVAVYALGCLVLDFYPHHGPPFFRYTGCDPACEVWNLGYPFALMIYDPDNGLNVGPFAYAVIPLQLSLVGVAFLVAVVARWLDSVGKDEPG